MTLTPEQLDDIATKMLERRDTPNMDNPEDVLLVMMAIVKWCGPKRWFSCEGDADGWTCAIYEWESPADIGPYVIANADTPAAAIFACAAKLVERL